MRDKRSGFGLERNGDDDDDGSGMMGADRAWWRLSSWGWWLDGCTGRECDDNDGGCNDVEDDDDEDKYILCSKSFGGKDDDVIVLIS